MRYFSPVRAVGRRNWTFAGSDRGADRAAALYTLIETARLNDVDPRAWLADVLARINDHPAKAIDDLLPWNWKAGNQADMYGPFPTARIFWLGTGSGHVYVLCWALAFRCLPWIMMVSRLAGETIIANVVEANNVVSF